MKTRFLRFFWGIFIEVKRTIVHGSHSLAVFKMDNIIFVNMLSRAKAMDKMQNKMLPVLKRYTNWIP